MLYFFTCYLHYVTDLKMASMEGPNMSQTAHHTQ